MLIHTGLHINNIDKICFINMINHIKQFVMQVSASQSKHIQYEGHRGKKKEDKKQSPKSLIVPQTSNHKAVRQHRRPLNTNII